MGTGQATPPGAAVSEVVLAHGSDRAPMIGAKLVTRQVREDSEQLLLAPGATRSSGAGQGGARGA